MTERVSMEPVAMTDHEVSAMFQRWHGEHGTTWADLIRRVEKLTLDKCAAQLQQARREALEAYCSAAADLVDWSDYASDYFKQKHDLEGCLKAHFERIEAMRALIQQGEKR